MSVCMNQLCFLLHLLPSLQLITPSASDKGTFSYVLSSSAVDPVYGVGLESTVPAVDLALDYINNNSTLLPGLNLTYGEVESLECPACGGLLEDILDDANIAILGYSCAQVATNDVGMFNFTPIIQYTAVSAEDLFNVSESVGQRALFTVHPTPRTYAEAVLAIIEQFGWQRFLTISNTEGERFFNDVLDNLVTLSTNVTLFESNYNSTAVNGTVNIIPADVRIVFINVNSSDALQIMCEAYKTGSVFPHYVWIAYAGDYEGLATDTRTACSRNQLAQFLEGVLTLQPSAGNGEWSVEAVNDVRMQNFSTLSFYAFDALLVLSQAVSDTLSGWRNNSPDWSFCEVENEVNKTSLTKCFVRQKIQNININGTTGAIRFNSQGNRATNIIGLHKYRVQGDERGVEFTQSELIAQVTVDESSRNVVTTVFEFADGENETTIFNGDIPPDGTPIKHFNNQPLAFVIIYYTNASMGILFAIFCLIFNVVFRKRKIVKLISPNLNYFVIAGAIMLYGLVYIRLLPSQATIAVNIRCNVQIFLVCVGYTLCFAPVLMKTWRVYYIFHNPSPTKKIIKDWHLILGTTIIVGIITALVFIGFAVPIFRGRPLMIADVERPYGTTEDGIRVENCIYQCYGFNVSLTWIALEYVYLLSLQVAAFILAILTRKVKVKVLNDSKWMIIIVYSSTTIMLILGVLTFAVGTRFILIEVIFCGLIMTATTIFLTILFIPKMVDLYKDPRGEGVFGRASDDSTTKSRSTTFATMSGTTELEISAKL